ncbi:hypothetical protein P4489_10305 [Heyndrickxia sporothermodurans]|uniref:hypothetical protein n=1 Tax=Heyndrickxia sporothermodurans TaxID=46224 RepID=UPI002E1BF16D|nr:hypothetical protein [Heyndrickxia sporothermodurans]
MTKDTFMSAFTFEGFKCDISFNEFVDTYTGDKIKELVLRNNNEKFRASYLYGEGLKEIGREKRGEKNNILGEFIGIEKNDLNSMMSFFKKYGFLFPLSDYDQFVTFQIEDVNYIKDNLEALINIFNAQDTNNIDYKSLLDSVLFLLLQKEKVIKINDNTCYKSSNKDLLHNINNANKIRFDDNSTTIQIPRDDGGSVPAFEVKDYLLGEGINVVIIEEYENLMQDDDYSLSFLKQIVKAYVSKKNTIFSEDECLIIDFLYHFSRRISIIIPEDISLNTLFQEVVYETFTKRENDDLKQALLKISKYLIEKELNHFLSEIKPKYDADTMRPNWKLPSLFSAMYLSLFYLDSNQAMYRVCQNINCNQLFLVSKTNQVKKYCCVYCTNAVSQRRYRQKK